MRAYLYFGTWVKRAVIGTMACGGLLIAQDLTEDQLEYGTKAKDQRVWHSFAAEAT